MEIRTNNSLKATSILLSAAVALLGTGFTPFQHFGEREASRDWVAQVSSGTSKDRTNELNTLFADAKPGDTIRLEKEVYKLDGHVILPLTEDVSIDALGAEFRGPAIFLAVNSSGLNWRGGTFLGDGTPETRMTFNLFKTRDSTFEDMVFDRVLSFGNHAFDLLGVDNVLIDGLSVEGYGDTPNTESLPPHSLYAEAVQVDYSLRTGVGNSRTEGLIEQHGGKFDGKPSKNITVQNSVFAPSFAPSGKLQSWAPSPFGNHSIDYHRPPVEYLTFRENVVIDPIPTNDLPSERSSGVIHFSQANHLTLSRNYFELSAKTIRSSWIEVQANHIQSSPRVVSEVTIAENVFAGSPPSHSYLLLSQRQGLTRQDPVFQVAGNTVTPVTWSVLWNELPLRE